MPRAFSQVDVFSAEPMLGNPVAVVHDADGLTDDEMASFARWTNLSETTFLLPPTAPGADYRLRIWTPGGELPFAGHPTLGSAHAWLTAGGTPKEPDRIVQECGVGLVELTRQDGRLAFQAPPLVRFGPPTPDERAQVLRALRIDEADLVDVSWVSNGPSLIAALLPSAEHVLRLTPDLGAMGTMELGAVGPYPPGSECAVEIRLFAPDLGIAEDPVTGSFNAGVGQWLAGTVLPATYVASQGTVLRRRGRVHISRQGDVVWVGGDTRTTISGAVDLAG